MTPQARTPYPWQIEGRDFLCNGGALLAFSPGLGKSLASLLADTASDPDWLYPLLIGCPSVAIGVWIREIRMVHPDAIVHVMTSGYVNPTAHFVIVSLNLPARNTDVLGALITRKWRRVLIDEAHKLKTHDSARTQEWFTGARPLVSLAMNRPWLLTGTPAPNGRADELYPLVMATQPDRLGRYQTYETFIEHYCTFKMAKRGKGKVRVIAGTNPVTRLDLNDKLKGWMLRRKVSDDDMPPILRRVIPLRVTDLEAYDEMMDSEEGRALQQAIETGDLAALDEIEDASLSRMRRALAQSKARAAADWVLSLIEDGVTKVVLFAWHIDALDTIEAVLHSHKIFTMKITGANSHKAKTIAEDAFQTCEGTCVFLGQSAAAGVAITLTSAHRMVIVEQLWVPGDNLQVEARCRRMGQKHTVVVDYLTAKDTVDEIVADIVVRKTAEIAALGA